MNHNLFWPAKGVLLFVDQYANKFRATSIEQLKSQFPERSLLTPMYDDAEGGRVNQIGFVITVPGRGGAEHWLTAWQPYEVRQ